MSGHNFSEQRYQEDFRVIDPGNAGVVRFDNQGEIICEIVSAGAETRTLNGPAKLGQIVHLVFKTDAGDVTVTVKDSAATPATTYTHVLNDAGDHVSYMAVEIGATLTWVMLSATGLGAAMTAQLTTLTHTAPGTPDYALQNLVQNTGFGFVTADEGNTVLSVIVNLQARMAQVETILEAMGLAKAN